MINQRRVAPSQSRLVVCEGKSDEFFFKELIKVHGIDRMEAAYPNKTAGNSQFGEFLKDLELTEGFIRGVVKLVIVAADNDDAKSFGAVCKEIRKAGYNPPTIPKAIVQTQGKPAITVLMVPDTPPGCLETLCVQAAYSKWPNLQQPLETYIGQTDVVNWLPTKQAKSKVECLLASTAEKRPAVALYDHWQMQPAYHIPVNDPAFASVAAFLTSNAVVAYR